MKHLRERLPIEELPPERWRRVETAVFAELDAGTEEPLAELQAEPRRAPWLALGAAALAAAAAVILAITWRAPQPSPIGSTTVTTGETGATARAGDATVHAGPHTSLVIVGDEERGVVVVLERGEVELAVPPRAERPPFVVEAGEVRVSVVGTRFSVARDEHVRVAVEEGRVRVTHGSRVRELTRGESWSSAPPRSQPGRRQSAEEAGAEPDRGASAEQPAPQLERASRDTARAEVGEAPRARVDRTAAGHATPGARDEAIAAQEGRSSPRRAPRAPRSRFAAASALEASDPAAAARIYRELEGEGGAWAANALYARARLAVEQGRTSEARALLTTYLARHPDGPNAADARRLSEELR
ncbi:MAG: FecR domain-containing protein [Sandaracinaceae bacterium]|nr:FecR domain-containing protein [Sandaracinaceae bacterium]